MSGRYRYPPNVRTVQISPKCQESQISPKCQDGTDIPQMSGTDIPQMSGEYRYPPNV
ncbi:unnamed protein product, partial [Staurois parvus]